MITALIIILLASIICVLIFGIVNLTKRVEKYEEQIDELETGVGFYRDLVDNIRQEMLETQARLTEVDIRGSFEADDEVGFVFKDIKSLVEDLNLKLKAVYE
jgi:cell division protein FtsB